MLPPIEAACRTGRCLFYVTAVTHGYVFARVTGRLKGIVKIWSLRREPITGFGFIRRFQTASLQQKGDEYPGVSYFRLDCNEVSHFFTLLCYNIIFWFIFLLTLYCMHTHKTLVYLSSN